MSDAPERIWASQSGSAIWFGEAHQTPPFNTVEYVHADLHEAEVARLRELLCAYVWHVRETEGTDFLIHYPGFSELSESDMRSILNMVDGSDE